MAKNGIGIKKNIETSIEYFNEGCACNDEYAYFNLSRIYYFGLNVNKNLTNFYNLIEKISNVSFFLGDLFLFYVNCGSFSNNNMEIAKKYLNCILNNKDVFKHIKKILSDMYYIPIMRSLLYERLENFLREYDLLHSYRTTINFDFESYILTGKFKDYFEEEEYDDDELYTNRKNINEQFYEGFNIDLNC